MKRHFISKEFQIRISERDHPGRNHQKNIFRKINISSVIGLIKYAYEHKLI